jgi:hypothetical protein
MILNIENEIPINIGTIIVRNYCDHQYVVYNICILHILYQIHIHVLYTSYIMSKSQNHLSSGALQVRCTTELTMGSTVNF